MADPVTTIIGLVSSIITFVEFGIKIVAETKNVRNSATGTTAEISELDLMIGDIRHFNELAKQQRLSRNVLSPGESHILAMVVECEKLVGQLQKTINTLRGRDGARLKTLESARVAVRSYLKRDEIQAIRSRLDILDRQIRGNLDRILQKEQNSFFMTKVAEIEDSHKKMDIQNESKLDLIRKDILRILADKTYPNNQVPAAVQTEQLLSLRTGLDMLGEEQRNCAQRIKVLESLYFPEIRRRWRQIPHAEQRTNEWIFDPKQTSFVSWLENQREGDSFFYITGRAGSGKSTLMKFASEHENTIQSLEKWADKAKLCTASYYFWNQGTEKQKSGVGLFQSLLYQILKSAPEFIQSVDQDRLHHEIWEMEDLINIFKRIPQQTGLDTKFCFFIDGLDEYDGEEKDITRLLRELSISKDIKICASSRPGRQYESILPRDDRAFDIARFTKGDMKRYIDTRLQACANWRNLVAADPICQDILNELSKRAGGVWLWVYLVTADVVKEAEKNEEATTLRKIVDDFPDDLYEYFERMIKKIPKIHREEMAQTFLVAIEAVRPLPLYAFELLEKERKNSDYALEAPIQPILEVDVEQKYPALTDRIRNRCNDLFIVDDGPRRVFLSHSVEFLHRTVRDFLQGDYNRQLRMHVKEEFNPLVSLCRIFLGLLKGLRFLNSPYGVFTGQAVPLTEEVMYYAREVEKRSSLREAPLVLLLDELNRVNSYHARDIIPYHWTHLLSLGSPISYGRHPWDEQRNFLTLAVQARLVKYVRAKLEADPMKMEKKGRPLLDYALQLPSESRIIMLYDLSLEADMVELLLEKGANPNQSVHLDDRTSVWGRFLLSIHKYSMQDHHSDNSASQSLNKAWYRACLALIQVGARSDCLSHKGDKSLSASLILNDVFGQDRAAILEQRMRQKEEEARPSKSSCVAM